MDMIALLSAALADRLAAAAPAIVALKTGHGHITGLLWRPDVVVTSEEIVGDRTTAAAARGGIEIQATLAGRDPTTNVAVFRLESSLPGALPATGGVPRVGSLALVAGADGTGAATARLAMVHATGPEWRSMSGGRIDSLIRLDVRLGLDEGGLVLDQDGAFLGMAAAGPRRRALVIPAATIARVVDPLLANGHIPRGFLGFGLQSVALSAALRSSSGQKRGSMVLQLVPDGPAEQAGVQAGDILLALDGFRFGQGRRIGVLTSPERIGEAIPLRLARAGVVMELPVRIGTRPES